MWYDITMVESHVTANSWLLLHYDSCLYFTVIVYSSTLMETIFNYYVTLLRNVCSWHWSPSILLLEFPIKQVIISNSVKFPDSSGPIRIRPIMSPWLVPESDNIRGYPSGQSRFYSQSLASITSLNQFGDTSPQFKISAVSLASSRMFDRQTVALTLESSANGHRTQEVNTLPHPRSNSPKRSTIREPSLHQGLKSLTGN